MHWDVIAPLSRATGGRTLLAHQAARLAVLRQLEQDPFWTQPQKTNVVAMREVTEEAGRSWGVFDVVKGVTLRELLVALEQSHVRAPAGLVARVVVDAAHALAAVQPRRVHGGLSDQSILVGFDGQSWVMDYGAPRANRFQPLQASPSRDVFALGAILHAALTDYVGKYGEPLSHRAPLKLPSQVDPSCPAAVDDVVQRALGRDDARQADLAMLAGDLERAFGDALATRGNLAAMLSIALKDRRADLESLLAGHAVGLGLSLVQEEGTDPDLSSLRTSPPPPVPFEIVGPPVLLPVASAAPLLPFDDATSTAANLSVPFLYDDRDDAESTQVLDVKKTRELLLASKTAEPAPPLQQLQQLPNFATDYDEDQPTMVLDGAKARELLRASAGNAPRVPSLPAPAPLPPPSVAPAVAPVVLPVRALPFDAPNVSPPRPNLSPPRAVEKPAPVPLGLVPAPLTSGEIPSLGDDEFDLLDEPAEEPGDEREEATTLMDVPPTPPRPQVAALPAPAPRRPTLDVPAAHPPASSPPSPQRQVEPLPAPQRSPQRPVPEPRTSPPHTRPLEDLVPVSAEHLVPAFGMKVDKSAQEEKPEKLGATVLPTIETRRVEFPERPPPSRLRVMVAVVLVVGALGAVRYVMTRPPPKLADPVKPVLQLSSAEAAANDTADPDGGLSSDEDVDSGNDALLPAKARPDAGRTRDSGKRPR